ncbi:MAG: hypothetical protein ACYS1A_09440 [Planctomycetota bacterium]
MHEIKDSIINSHLSSLPRWSDGWTADIEFFTMLFMDKLLKINVRILISCTLALICNRLISLLALTHEDLSAIWKMPTIVVTFIILFILLFWITKRVLPMKKTPLIKNRLLSCLCAIILSLLTFLFCCVPFLVTMILLPGYWQYNKTIPGNEVPSGATFVDLANTDIFNQFDGARRELLERYLAANSRWNVRHWDERKVAFLCRQRKDGWERSMNMYFLEPDFFSENYEHSKSYQYRVGLYLGYEKPKISSLRKGPSQAIAGTTGINVTIFKSPSSDTRDYESWLWVEGKSIAVEIFEQSKQVDREHTQKFLDDVCAELEKLVQIELEMNIDDLLVDGSFVGRSLCSLAIENEYKDEDGYGQGIYKATGYINPMQKGYIYIKAFDKKTGKPLSEARTRNKVEYPGWSEDPSKQYYYQFEFTIYEGDWSHPYPAAFELWFHPDDSGPERKLIETTRKICGWQR